MIAAIELTGVLGDATYLALTAALFGVARLLLAACRRIAGDDDLAEVPPNTAHGTGVAAEPEAVAA